MFSCFPPSFVRSKGNRSAIEAVPLNLCGLGSNSPKCFNSLFTENKVVYKVINVQSKFIRSGCGEVRCVSLSPSSRKTSRKSLTKR